MEKTYLKPTIDGAMNLYHVTIEYDDRTFVVAIQGGKDFETRLSDLIDNFWQEFLKEGSIVMLEGSEQEENAWQAETVQGSVIYIQHIDIW